MSHINNSSDESKVYHTAADIENQANAKFPGDHPERDDDMVNSDQGKLDIVVPEVLDAQVGKEAREIYEANGYLSSSNSSFRDQCRICQQDKEEALIDLGCYCRGGLAKAHRSCIDSWFQKRGSNECEICQVAAANVPPPESFPNIDKLQDAVIAQDHTRVCKCSFWTAVLILMGGLLVDAFISLAFGVSTMLNNMIIGAFILFGLGTATQLALEVCHKWYMRRAAERADRNVNPVQRPTV